MIPVFFSLNLKMYSTEVIVTVFIEVTICKLIYECLKEVKLANSKYIKKLEYVFFYLRAMEFVWKTKQFYSTYFF